MAGIATKSFDSPDETRTPPKTKVDVVRLEGATVAEGDARPGDACVIEPGHDAWVVGDEPVVAFQFASAETYAKS